MSLLPISEAAKLVGKHPTTLKAAMKKGKLSASKNEHGEWQIDISEVTRIYPIKNDIEKKEGDKKIITPSHQSSLVLKEEVIILKQENAVLREKVLGLEKEILIITRQLEQSDDREKEFRKILSQNTKLLTHYADKETQQEEKKSGFKWSLFKG